MSEGKVLELREYVAPVPDYYTPLHSDEQHVTGQKVFQTAVDLGRRWFRGQSLWLVPRSRVQPRDNNSHIVASASNTHIHHVSKISFVTLS